MEWSSGGGFNAAFESSGDRIRAAAKRANRDYLAFYADLEISLGPLWDQLEKNPRDSTELEIQPIRPRRFDHEPAVANDGDFYAAFIDDAENLDGWVVIYSVIEPHFYVRALGSLWDDDFLALIEPR